MGGERVIGEASESRSIVHERRIVIRAAGAGDRQALQDVLLDAYGEYEEKLPGEKWFEYKASILHAIEEAPTSARLVAELNGEVVGSVFLFDSAEKAYGHPELGIESPILRLLAVSRKARGAGVATELIRASANFARDKGAATLHLHTSDLMDAAIRLYERLGFERAYDKEFMNGDILVKSYRLQLGNESLLG